MIKCCLFSEQSDSLVFSEINVQKYAENSPFFEFFFGLNIRPRRYASYLLDLPCDDIWIITLAFGRSMALSPTLEKKRILILLSCLNFSMINSLSLIDTSPQINGHSNFSETYFKAKISSVQISIITPLAHSKCS